ncbi:MAG: YidC/Oxa1 family membrane protein insertase [Oscillospiraceae bacterium]|nr:YidC/Oxa1 family membrane protein insertase [Oscillospiraceae bacterium]
MGIILTPFAWLLMLFYDFSQNYGIALILFALVIKLVLFPFNLKGKKSMIQMNLLSSKMQQLQKQYGKDRERYNLEIQKLYEKEKVNPMSGCLWSFIPIIFLMVLYGIIREPLTYLMNVPADMINTVAEITGVANSGTYPQIAMLKAIADPAMMEQVKAALGDAGAGLFSMNVEFLGINLANIPQLNFWSAEGGLVWGNIGLFLLPLVSVGTSLLSMYVSMKTNQMNRGGEQNDQMAKTNRTMMIFMPIMSLWIGFTVPAGLSIYWIAQYIFSIFQELICGRLLKKDYERARAEAAERERQEKEDEKRRKEEARLERQRRLEEEKKNRGKKKPKKAEPTEPGINKDDSRIGIRAYARGRAYDPNRFGGVQPYRDPSDLLKAQAEAQNAQKGKKGRKDKKEAEKTSPAPEKETKPISQEEQPQLTQVQETPVQEAEAAPEIPAPAEAETAAPEAAPVETEEVEVEVEQVEVEIPEDEDDKKEGV